MARDTAVMLTQLVHGFFIVSLLVPVELHPHGISNGFELSGSNCDAKPK